MKGICRCFILAIFASANPVAPSIGAAGTPRSSHGWTIATPEEVGIDSPRLVEMFDFVRARPVAVHSVQIIRRGRLVLDAYFYPYDGSTRHDVASVTKSITSMLVGLAIDRDAIRDVRQPVLEFFPVRADAELERRKPGPTIEDLLTMRSGWDCGFEPNEARLFEMRRSPDWVQFMLNLPLVAEPGTRWAYCSGNCHVLSAILTRATGMNAFAFGRRELFEPLDIPDVFWTSDPVGNSHGWGDLQLHPLDMAKLGQLFLQRGRWGERQVIPEAWVRESTRAHVDRTSNRDGYGYYWWVKGTDYPGMFEAVGRGGQRINVWPERELVIVFTGGGFEPGDLAGFIVQSVKSDVPLAANPESNRRLQVRVAEAAESPTATPVPEQSDLAGRISGLVYALEPNQLELGTLRLRFNRSSQAILQLQRLGTLLECPVGLDGVERFSRDTLEGLPFACKGRWLSDRVFLLELDRVAGISSYRFQINFTEDGKSVTIELKERSGLSGEKFGGAVRS